MSERTVKVKAWGRMVKAYAEQGRVWVYDSVAGHFTTCHSLTHPQIMRVIRLAHR